MSTNEDVNIGEKLTKLWDANTTEIRSDQISIPVRKGWHLVSHGFLNITKSADVWTVGSSSGQRGNNRFNLSDVIQVNFNIATGLRVENSVHLGIPDEDRRGYLVTPLQDSKGADLLYGRLEAQIIQAAESHLKR